MLRLNSSLFITKRRRRLSTVAFVFVLAAVFFISGTDPAFAQQAALDQMRIAAGFGGAPLPIIVARLIRTFLSVLGIIAVILFIYAGWLYMTAAGDAKQVERSKQMMIQIGIGLIIIFASFSITQFILGQLLGGTGFGGGVTTQPSPTELYSEPLSAGLGAGVIQDHYPPRNAVDVPRNTIMIVTFKVPIDPSTIIENYDPNNPSATDLNTDNVLIYPTAQDEAGALSATDIAAYTNTDNTTFTFQPANLLGSPTEDVNYTVALQPGILRDNGEPAFTGVDGDGYEWTFEVSTEIDNTPPQVVSVKPTADGPHPRNSIIEATFTEAMNPVSVNTATFNVTESGNTLDGVVSIANNYRTVSFRTNEVCATDPCGNDIYCLPGLTDLLVTARAATPSDDEAVLPRAKLINGLTDGLVDAAMNALDGNGNWDPQDPVGTIEGSPADDFAWGFSTSSNIDDRQPSIDALSPTRNAQDVGSDADVEVTFSMPMMASSLTNSNIHLWPDPWYEFWWVVGSEDLDDQNQVVQQQTQAIEKTRAVVRHQTFIPSTEQAWDYYPLITHGVKGANQFCMHPAQGVGLTGTDAEPYVCWDGTTVSNPDNCTTDATATPLPDTSQ